MKKYLIKESQINALIQKKKEDKIINRFHEDVNKINKSLKSNKLINEYVADMVIIYRKKGLLTKGVIDRLNEENFIKENSIII